MTASEQRPFAGAFAHKSPLNDDFASFAKKTMDKWKVPGLSIAVIDDEDIYAEGYGFAKLPDILATPQTIWYGASTTKAFVGALLAHLIDSKGHESLSDGWNTPIASIIRDDFVLQDEWATNHITLEDAVSHRTGLPEWDITSRRVVAGRPSTPKDAVRNLRNLPLTAQPRVKYQYSNFMFITLSHVLQTITGRWAGDVLKETIWAPLGMSSTYFALNDAIASEKLAQGYYWDEKDTEYHEVPHMPVSETSGAGAIFSNVLDYARWVKSLLHRTGPLSEAVHEDMRTPRSIMPTSNGVVRLYCLGWRRYVYRGHVVYTHSGGMHAFGAQVYWLPDFKYGVVSFANTALTSNAAEDALVFKLLDAKLGIEDKDRDDPEKKWDDLLTGMAKDYEDALSNSFPDIPEKPIPSTGSVNKLAGTYRNAGFFDFTMHVKSLANGEKVLSGSRDDGGFPIVFDLHHVSGDWWMMWMSNPQNPPMPEFRQWARVEFLFGADASPTAMEVQFSPAKPGEQNEKPKILFMRVQ